MPVLHIAWLRFNPEAPADRIAWHQLRAIDLET